MSSYKKILGGNGVHGTKYEIHFILYNILKTYLSEENFEMTHGDKVKVTLDDIILKTETLNLYIQSKHAENNKKTLTDQQLFGPTGDYSLCVYLNEAYTKIFREFFVNVLNNLEALAKTIPQDGGAVEDLKNTVISLLNTNLDQIDNFNFEYFISNLRKLNCQNLNELLSIDNSFIHLVTNRIPNEKLTNFCANSKTVRNFEDIEEYNFNTDESVTELLKLKNKLNVPKWFINFFLKKISLIVIKDNTMHTVIKNCFELLSSKSDIFKEINYNDMYELTDNWKFKKKGVVLTRSEVDETFLAYIISNNFKKELKAYEELIEFDIDPLLHSINMNFITIVKTPRYLLNMAVFQKKLEEHKSSQTLFVNPLSSLDTQKFVIKSFLHKTYTYLICALHKDAADVGSLVNDIVLKIEGNAKLLRYKKIIIFCNNVELKYAKNTMLSDDKWFENCKLHFKTPPHSLSEMKSCYIDRRLSSSFLKQPLRENEFIKNVVFNNDFVLISNSSGMGKTTILSSIAVEINKIDNFWTVIIHLNDPTFTDLLERHFESQTVPHLNEFLQVLLNMNDPFVRQICEIPNIFILMVDGFDEICPDYKDVVTEFLKNTRSMKNVKTIIVTTLVHFQQHLEEQLNVKSFALEPLTDDDICTFIREYGKLNINFVKNWYRSVPSSLQNFLGVPQHVSLFVELYPKLNKELSNKDFNINLYELFEAFVEKKNDNFVKQKCKSQGNVRIKSKQKEEFRNLLIICTQLALKESKLKTIGNAEYISKASNDDLCATGILELFRGSLRFIHKSFEDFFVARWAISIIFDKNKCKSKIFEVIFEKVLNVNYRYTNQRLISLNRTHNNIDSFVNAYLEKHWHMVTDEILIMFADNSPKYQYKLFDFIVSCFFESPFYFKLLTEKINDSIYLTSLFGQLCSNSQTRFNFQKHSFSSFLKKKFKINLTKERLLHLLTEIGDLESIKLLIEEENINVLENVSDANGRNILHIAAASPNQEVIKYLISKGANVNKKTKRGENVLHIAVYSGNLELVKYLIREGVNIHEKDFKGRNMLHIAADRNNLEVVDYLIENGVNLNEKTKEGKTVFHTAVDFNNLDLVEYLIDKGIHVNQKTNKGENVLHLASSQSHLDLIKYFISQGVKINTEGEHIPNILGDWSNLDFIKYLVGKGVNVHEKTNKGENVLHLIVRRKNLDVIGCWISQGVNIQEKRKKEENHLEWDPFWSHLHVIKYLISQDVNIGEKTNKGENLLHLAVYRSDLELIKYLMGQRINIDEKTNNGYSALHLAVYGGKFAIVKYLIENGANKNEKTNRGENVLHIAVYRGKLKLIDYLISKEVDIHDKMNNDHNILHVAVNTMNFTLAKALINKGVNIKEKTNKGENMLHLLFHYNESLSKRNRFFNWLKVAGMGNTKFTEYLISKREEMDCRCDSINDSANLWIYYREFKENFLEFVKYLISKGVNVTETTDNGENVLHLAVGWSNLDIIKYLSQRVNIHEKTDRGENVLHIAVRNENFKVIEYLIEQGVDINEKTNEGENVLHLAVSSENFRIAEYLVENGANMSEKTDEGRNLLHLAAYRGNLKFIKYFISKGLDIHEKTNLLENVLHLAVYQKNLELISFLISKEVSVADKTIDDRNMLQLSVCRGIFDVAKYLIENEVANIHGKTNKGENLIHLATQCGHLKLIKYLISKGIHINDKTNKGESVLHLAVCHTNLGIVKYLIGKGVNIKEKTNKGENVLNLAVQRGHLKLIKYLRNKGVDINNE